ncbi:MAG: M42 family peptidase, partial [Clostridia bacterium]|nr:M42 family peptidase [Clostridia bacterium]
MDRIYDIAAGLTQVPGVSGEEERSFPYLKETYGSLFDEIGFTPVSSFYGIRYSKKKDAPTVLLDAHLDTIGFIVTDLLDGGFLKVAPIGGIAEKILPASEVWIHGKKTIPGVFTSKPPHLQERGDEEKPMKISDLLVDTGLNCKKKEL